MCPRRSSFKRLLRSAILSSLIVHLLKVCWIFVKRTYLKVCWRSTVDPCLMNLPKRSSFKSVLKVYTLSKILLWIKPSYFSLENACYSWCMHQTGLFSSASVVPQSKFTGELWSSASVVPQSKSTEMWSSAAPFHHDVWYFRHWTNKHFILGRYKSRTGSTRTASPGRINSDRLGSNKKIKIK